MNPKVKSIITQTIIGGLLIRVSMRYISHHPAEKVGIFSTFDYVYQKAQGISKIFHGRTQGEVDELTQYKTSFKELKQVATSKACEKAIQGKNLSQASINQVMQNLESTSSEEFTRNKTKYIAVFNQINETINKYCK